MLSRPPGCVTNIGLQNSSSTFWIELWLLVPNSVACHLSICNFAPIWPGMLLVSSLVSQVYKELRETDNRPHDDWSYGWWGFCNLVSTYYLHRVYRSFYSRTGMLARYTFCLSPWAQPDSYLIITWPEPQKKSEIASNCTHILH